mgnify:CR=1 FL=1
MEQDYNIDEKEFMQMMMENWKKELKQLQDIPGRMYNVGCMMSYMNYTPRTLEEIIDGYNNTK